MSASSSPTPPPFPRQSHREIGRDRGFPDTALAGAYCKNAIHPRNLASIGFCGGVPSDLEIWGGAFGFWRERAP